MGESYTHIVGKKLAEKAGYTNVPEYFRSESGPSQQAPTTPNDTAPPAASTSNEKM